ncbi:DUF892 family protein [Deinococcus ruber]|uniref:DUF892 domain-containing protein n=1 Tax=Deinococcus ruber TaxID=1848197 RepID=A0A918BWW8_9DEIO|nr:DUF892 family protein [Deinococcus ruber]GGQ93075.1 hypothetical protein GCM10008957_01300 [Deinococcus ruber]
MSLAELNLRPSEIRALYLIHLHQTYSAECQALDALPHLALNVSSLGLRQRLLLSATDTPEHVKMLETVFTELAEVPGDSVCEPMKALIQFGADLLEQYPYGPARDLLLVGVAQEMKHLGIAKYAMSETFASVLGCDHQQMRFSKAKSDEEMTDRELGFSILSLRLTEDRL